MLWGEKKSISKREQFHLKMSSIQQTINKYRSVAKTDKVIFQSAILALYKSELVAQIPCVVVVPKEHPNYARITKWIRHLNEQFRRKDLCVVIIHEPHSVLVKQCEKIQDIFNNGDYAKAIAIGQDLQRVNEGLPIRYPIYYSVFKPAQIRVQQQMQEFSDGYVFRQLSFVDEAIDRYTWLDYVPASIWNDVIPVLDVDRNFKSLFVWRYVNANESRINIWNRLLKQLGDRATQFYVSHVTKDLCDTICKCRKNMERLRIVGN